MKVWTILKDMYTLQLVLSRTLSPQCYKSSWKRSNIGGYVLLWTLTTIMASISAKLLKSTQILLSKEVCNLTSGCMFRQFFDSSFMFCHQHTAMVLPSGTVCSQPFKAIFHYNTLMMIPLLPPAKVSSLSGISPGTAWPFLSMY